MAMVSSHPADRGDEVAASATRGGVVWKNDDRRLFFNRNHGGDVSVMFKSPWNLLITPKAWFAQFGSWSGSSG